MISPGMVINIDYTWMAALGFNLLFFSIHYIAKNRRENRVDPFVSLQTDGEIPFVHFLFLHPASRFNPFPKLHSMDR